MEEKKITGFRSSLLTFFNPRKFPIWTFLLEIHSFSRNSTFEKIKNLMKICIFRILTIFVLVARINGSKNIFQCDFERNDWCELEDFLDGDFQIRQNNGKTTTPLTGIG